MELNSLPEIVFVDADKNKVEEAVLGEYESITGRTLARGDPVRLFLLTIANIIILQMNAINETGKQNLLRYAKGDNLDHLGAFMGVDRMPAAASRTTMKLTLSAVRDVSTVIPEGTRFTAGDNIFFALTADVLIPAGETEGEGEARCQTAGPVGNGYAAGALATLVDPVPYVAAVENTTVSEGGADEQDDDSYREDIHIAPESFSVAGPAGAYEYFAKRASALITDVSVTSPSPGEVEVRPLLEGGEIPGEELLDAVEGVLSADDVRPLTDHVTVLAPEKKEYAVKFTYYISRDNQAQAETIRQAVETAAADFQAWQKEKLGRDINPSELIARVVKAGAKRVEVESPVYTKLAGTQVAISTGCTEEYGGIEDE